MRLFTGAAVYITFIEHPARMQCGVEIARNRVCAQLGQKVWSDYDTNVGKDGPAV